MVLDKILICLILLQLQNLHLYYAAHCTLHTAHCTLNLDLHLHLHLQMYTSYYCTLHTEPVPILAPATCTCNCKCTLHNTQRTLHSARCTPNDYTACSIFIPSHCTQSKVFFQLDSRYWWLNHLNIDMCQ